MYVALWARKCFFASDGLRWFMFNLVFWEGFMVKIEILGSGCANCKRLEALAKDAVSRLGLQAQVEHVTDIREIIARRLMATPGLAINGKIVLAGRVPSAAEVEGIIAGAVKG